jgi:hypothetical protein
MKEEPMGSEQWNIKILALQKFIGHLKNLNKNKMVPFRSAFYLVDFLFFKIDQSQLIVYTPSSNFDLPASETSFLTRIFNMLHLFFTWNNTTGNTWNNITGKPIKQKYNL